MKIGIVAPNLRMPAGIGKVYLNLTEKLIEIDKTNSYSVLTHEQENRLRKIKYVKLFKVPFVPNTILNFFQLPIIASKNKYDVLHFIGHIPTFLTKQTKSKIITTLHDLTPILFPNFHTTFNNYMFRYILPLTIKNSDRVIAISQATKRDIVRLLHVPDDKVSVVYIAANEKFKPMKNAKEQLKKKFRISEDFILFVSTIEPRKNLQRLIKAYFLAKKIGMKEKLVIVGSPGWGDGYNNVRKLVKSLNLTDDILFMGYVNDKDLPFFYNSAKVFIYPSIYEGFGIPPLEAMQCGCPVIASNTSSIPEVVGDAGILIDPYNEHEMAERMLEVLKSESLRKELRERGLRQAKKFSWEKCARETIRVYESLSL